LIGGEYVPLSPEQGRLHSDILGLDLVTEGKNLRFHHPRSGKRLPTYAELEAARQAAESEVVRLREQIEQLRRRKA